MDVSRNKIAEGCNDLTANCNPYNNKSRLAPLKAAPQVCVMQIINLAGFQFRFLRKGNIRSAPEMLKVGRLRSREIAHTVKGVITTLIVS